MSIFDVTLEHPIEDLLACPDEEVGVLLELEDIVGKGGFATVWRASFDGQRCACKVLQPRGGTLPPAPIVRLFIRECVSLLSMEHSAVILCAGLIRMRMVDFPELGLTYDTYGMLLEFCEGGTLKDLLLAQLIYKQDQYSVREALSWLAQVASALQQFHSLEMPIIHRDIKPENILLQPVVPSSTPGFWQPSQQQQRAGVPRKRLGSSGGGGGSFRPRQHLNAKLADLGLGVRVCVNRSVLIRCRAAPAEGDAAADAAAAAAPAGAEDDEALQVLFGGGGGAGGAAVAAAAGSQRVEEVRMPFMGFTTTPVRPPKRLGSNQRKPSRGRSISSYGAAGGGDGGGTHAGPVDVAASSSAAPSPVDLHRAALINNVRARLSGTREQAGSWAVQGEAAVAAAAVAAAATPAGGGGGGGSPQRPSHPLSTEAALNGGGGGGSGDRHYADGPSPFRDLLQQQQQQQPGSEDSPSITASVAAVVSAAVSQQDAATGPSPRADCSGAADAAPPSPFSLQYSQSLGHGPNHMPSLAPISERSLSAEDTTTTDGSDCRSGAMNLNGTVTLTSSGTMTTAAGTTAPLSLLQSSVSRQPPVRNHHNHRILYTIREPDDSGHPPLPSTASAPVPIATATTTATAAAAPHHPHRLPSLPGQGPGQQPPSPPPSPPPPPQRRSPQEPLDHHHHHHHHKQQQNAQQHHQQGGGGSGSAGRLLLAAAAGSVRESLRWAVAAAGAGLGALPPRLGGGGSGGGWAPTSESHLFLLQSTTSIPTPTCRIDMEPESDQAPQQLHPHSKEQQQQQQHHHHHHQFQPSPTAQTPSHLQQQQQQQQSTATAVVPSLLGLAVPPSPPTPLPPLHPPTHPIAVGDTAAGQTHATLLRGETLTASATATATGPATATATISSRLSRDRTSFGISSLVRPTLRELRHSESLTRAMRRVGSLLRSLKVATLPKFRRGSQFQWVYGFTGQAGSCMYMAPEVFQGEPYNEKVDVHSFGVMMYELLSRELLLLRYIGGTKAGLDIGVKDPQQYARKTCEGFRPPRHPRIPEAQWKLIQACWHTDPLVRPDMAEVVAQLEAALAEGAGLQPQGPATATPPITSINKSHQLPPPPPLQPPPQQHGKPSKGGEVSPRLNVDAEDKVEGKGGAGGAQVRDSKVSGPGCRCVIC